MEAEGGSAGAGRAMTDEEQGECSAFPFVLDSNLWRTVSRGPFDLVALTQGTVVGKLPEGAAGAAGG